MKSLLENPLVQLRGDNYYREAIRYFQSPYGEIHQESLESGEFHKKLSRITFSILRSLSREEIAEVVWETLENWVKNRQQPIQITNLFTEIRPLMIVVMFKLLFKENISSKQLSIYSKAIENLHDTLKGTALRSHSIRRKMYEDIKEQVKSQHFCSFFQKKDLEELDNEILAKHIGGVFFHTGVVQILEFICHTLVPICQIQEIKNNLQEYVSKLNWYPQWEEIDTYNYLDYVCNESLRLFPLIGKTNRQVSETFTSEDISFEKNSVLYINFYKNHRLHWDNPEEFKPNRWDENSAEATAKQIRKDNFLPFGTAPRTCPAESFSRNIGKLFIIGILKYTDFKIPTKYIHTRRIPEGVPVVMSLNSCAEKIRSTTINKSRDVSASDLLISLENSLDAIDESASVELSIRKIVNQIFRDLQKGSFRLAVFYPLIRDVDIWFNFYLRKIQKK
ncbi:hypothetical protein AsFPU3_2226 [Aphanothece sacrum FPU3]|nr:hypothetical protein AsFPU3_2226 [Aphanothece sacrum FPU3]